MDDEEETSVHAKEIARFLLAKGFVQRVGFRRFVEAAAWEHELSGSVENLKDGSVKIFVQGPKKSLDEFTIKIKNAPPPIVVKSLDSKEARVTPLIHGSFRIKSGPIALEIQEGFGAMQAEFRDYRAEFRDYRGEFRGFANQTNQNFSSLDTKYGEISSKLTEILTELKTENREALRELKQTTQALLVAIEKLSPQNQK